MPYRHPGEVPEDRPVSPDLVGSMSQLARHQQDVIKHARLAERAALVAIVLAVIAFLCQTVVILGRWGWL